MATQLSRYSLPPEEFDRQDSRETPHKNGNGSTEIQRSKNGTHGKVNGLLSAPKAPVLLAEKDVAITRTPNTLEDPEDRLKRIIMEAAESVADEREKQRLAMHEQQRSTWFGRALRGTLNAMARYPSKEEATNDALEEILDRLESIPGFRGSDLDDAAIKLQSQTQDVENIRKELVSKAPHWSMNFWG